MGSARDIEWARAKKLCRLSVEEVRMARECPKGKPECLVPGCGASLFLRQHEGFTLDPHAFEPQKTVLLFDRARPFGPPSLDHWGDQVPF